MLINCTSVYHKKHTFTAKRSKGENYVCVFVCGWGGSYENAFHALLFYF